MNGRLPTVLCQLPAAIKNSLPYRLRIVMFRSVLPGGRCASGERLTEWLSVHPFFCALHIHGVPAILQPLLERSVTMNTFLLSLVSLILLAWPGSPSGQALCSIVINEIMYDPHVEETEWIEIFNASGSAVELSGWTLEDSDSTKPRLIADAPVLLAADAYLCIVQDPSLFMTTFPSASCSALKPLGAWPRLNNSGDRIIIRDARGTVVDMVEFVAKWGGQDGRSLERIHPDWPSRESGTWSSCSPPATSTPCLVNSIFSSSPADRASISVHPDPFETETEISYLLTVPTAIVKLEIYDIKGRLVRRLIDQEARGSAGTVTWQGNDEEGHPLRAGIYIVYLEAIHAERGVLEKARATVTLARGLR